LNDIALVGDFDDPDRWTLTNAYSINGDYMVGDGLRHGATRALRLKRSAGAIDQISGGWFSESAYDVNAAGDVVGAGFLTAALEARASSARVVCSHHLSV